MLDMGFEPQAGRGARRRHRPHSNTGLQTDLHLLFANVHRAPRRRSGAHWRAVNKPVRHFKGTTVFEILPIMFEGWLRTLCSDPADIQPDPAGPADAAVDGHVAA